MKLAWSFAAPAVTSSISSETSKENISSCAFSARSVMTLILLLVVLVLLDPRSPDSIRVVHGKVIGTSALATSETDNSPDRLWRSVQDC